MTAAILLAVASLALLVLEVFFVSFGAIALLAVGCGVGSVLLSFQESAALGWSMVSVLLVGGPFCIWGAFRLLPKLPFGNRIILDRPNRSDKERHAAAPALTELLGCVGEATSPLRPAGTALLNGHPYSVVLRGGMLDPGALVRVEEVQGNRILVIPHTGTPAGADDAGQGT